MGAAVMLVSGVIPWEQAVAAVDAHTLLLLFGMMIVAPASLRLSGFFRLVTNMAARRANSPVGLVGVRIVAAGVLSALFINDVVCLVMAPILIQVVRRHRLPPTPYLVALATTSNVGSMATLTGRRCAIRTESSDAPAIPDRRPGPPGRNAIIVVSAMRIEGIKRLLVGRPMPLASFSRTVVVFGYRDAEEATRYGSRDVRETGMQVYDLAAVRRTATKLRAGVRSYPSGTHARVSARCMNSSREEANAVTWRVMHVW